MSKIVVRSIEEDKYNFLITNNLIYTQSTERNKKRIVQMQKRKAYLNETEPIQVNDNLVLHSLPCTAEITPNNIDSITPDRNLKQEICIINHTKPDVEVVVSDLDCSLESYEQKDISDNQSIPTNQMLFKQSNPFIKLNNHLKIKAMRDGENSTLSYNLALNQEDNTESKSTYYQVRDIIKEEKENEQDSHYQKHKSHQGSLINITKHKISKSDDYGLLGQLFRCGLLKTKNHNTISSSSSIVKKKLDDISRIQRKNSKSSRLKIITSFNLSRLKIIKNTDGEIINNKLQTKTHLRSQTAYFSNDSKNNNYMKESSNKLPKICSTFMNTQLKGLCCKLCKENSNVNKKTLHRKNLTIALPSKSLFNLKDKSILPPSIINYPKKTTFAALSNREIIAAMLDKLQYISIDYHINALKELNQSKKNMCVLIKTIKEPSTFLFIGLYEIGTNEEYANKVFSSTYCPSKISFNEVKGAYFFNAKNNKFTQIIDKKQPMFKFFDEIHCVML